MLKQAIGGTTTGVTRDKRLPLFAVRELQVWEVTPRELMVVAEAVELLRVGELRVAGDLGKVLVEVRLVLYAQTVPVARNARHKLSVVVWVAGLLVGERLYLVPWTLMAGCEHGSDPGKKTSADSCAGLPPPPPVT